MGKFSWDTLYEYEYKKKKYIIIMVFKSDFFCLSYSYDFLLFHSDIESSSAKKKKTTKQKHFVVDILIFERVHFFFPSKFNYTKPISWRWAIYVLL